MFLELAGAAAQRGQKAGAAKHRDIRAWLEGVRADATMTNDKLCDQVHHCRISYTRDRKTLKIRLEGKETDVQPHMPDSLKQLGAAVLRGTPPKSHQERLNHMVLGSVEAA